MSTSLEGCSSTAVDPGGPSAAGLTAARVEPAQDRPVAKGIAVKFARGDGRSATRMTHTRRARVETAASAGSAGSWHSGRALSRSVRATMRRRDRGIPRRPASSAQRQAGQGCRRRWCRSRRLTVWLSIWPHARRPEARSARATRWRAHGNRPRPDRPPSRPCSGAPPPWPDR